MMLLGGKKKMASSIVDGLSPKGPMESEGEMDDSYGKKAAMQKFMACMKSGDAAGCASAMDDYMALHESSEDDAGEPIDTGEVG